MPSQWGAIASRNKAKLLKVAVATSKAMAKKVIKRSPVDTGRFKGNWNSSINAPDLTMDRGSGGGSTEVANRLKIGDTFYFVNNLHYALRLEFGWSNQAPMGMIRLTVAEYRDTVDAEVNIIMRTS